MTPPPDRTQGTADCVAACLCASARGRARTAWHLSVRGPGAAEEILLQALLTAVIALGLIRLF